MIQDVSKLVYLHMRPHTFKDGLDRPGRPSLRPRCREQLEDLNLLVRCDVTTRNEKLQRARSSGVSTSWRSGLPSCASKRNSIGCGHPIDGNEVMEYLNIDPGPRVGVAMNLLLEYRIDEGPYSPEEAYELLDGWVADGLV